MRLGIFQPDAGGATLPERVAMLGDALTGTTLDLVVCPELYARGYHIDASHRDFAQPSTGAYFEAFSALAQHYGAAIVFGYPEAADGLTYHSAALVAGDGSLVANHRKRLGSPGSFEAKTFANGGTWTLFELQGLRIAVVICYEIEFPETARAAAQAGADLLVVPTALVDQWAVVAEKIVPTRAFENGLWLAYANHAGKEKDHSYLGGSRIVAPDGQETAVAGAGPELITATIDPEAVSRARARLPYLIDAPKL